MSPAHVLTGNTTDRCIASIDDNFILHLLSIIEGVSDDVDDPYRRSTATHTRVADEIGAAVATIADALRAAR